MPVRVLLEPGCCPAGSGAAVRVRLDGGKAVAVRPPAHGGAALGVAVDDDGDGLVVLPWAARLAPVLGLHRDVVVAGLPVPLTAELAGWEVVAGHVDDARCDAVVVRLAALDALSFVDAPAVAVRVLDARLDALAPLAVDDPAAASLLEETLELRRAAQRLAGVAGSSVCVGAVPEHERHGCARHLLGLPRVGAEAPLGEVDPGTGARPSGDDFVWWCALPGDEEPALETDGALLHVTTRAGVRAFALPAALTRCTVVTAEVVEPHDLDEDGAAGAGTRLEVRLRPDPSLWR